MPYTDAQELTNVADYTDTTGPADYDASYRDTGFPGFKKLRRAARGAVSQVKRAAVRGVPAVAQLMRAPDLLQKTQSAAGAVALRTLRKADPAAYLQTVKSGARLLASRPEFNAAISGAKLIPGVGSAVSSGLAAAAALGQGESLEDVAIAAAREGLATNPATAFAFDTAVGLAKGNDLPDAAIEAARGQIPGGAAGKAAFDAGLALARRGSMDPDMVNAVRSGLDDGDTGAFDDLISRAGRVMRRDQLPDFPGLTTSQVQAARAIMTLPRLRRMRVRDAAGELGIGTRETQEAIAACCNHLGNTSAIDWSDVGDLETAEEAGVRLRVVKSGQAWDRPKKIRPANHAGARRIPRIKVSRKWAMQLGKMGGPAVQSALIRHGILARIAGDTGELTGPTAWTIRTGDFPSGIAQKLTGNGGRWKEMLAVNPGMTTYTDSNGATQIKPWAVGQSVNVPPAWVGASTTTPTPGTPAPPVAPPAPATTTATSSAGGPPFPAPSKYPNGYPGSSYTVQAGDFGTKIAETITGNGSRWRELLVLNPGKADAQYGIKIFAGDVLKLPSNWQAMAAPPAKVPAGPPAMPTPAVPPPGFPAGLPNIPTPAQPTQAQAVVATAQQIAIVQAMLVTFHGKHPDAGFLAPYGATRYGGQGDDLSGTWSQRSQVALASFERWWNTKGKQPPVAQDGYPDEAAVAALQRQTSEDINVPIPGTEIPAVAGGMTPPTQTAPASSSSSSSGAGPAIAALLGAWALFG